MAMTAKEFIELMKTSEVPFLSLKDEELIQEIRTDISEVVGELLVIMKDIADKPGEFVPTSTFLRAAGNLQDKMEIWYKKMPPQRIRAFGTGFCQQMLADFKEKGVSMTVTECWVANMMESYRISEQSFKNLGWGL